MIGIDTNILVRYFMGDDLLQSDAATRFIDSLSPANPGFLSLLNIAELWWVLSRSYKVSHDQLFTLISNILDSEDLTVEKHDLVQQALKIAEPNGADLADCLITHSAIEAGCSQIMTFDRLAAKSAGMSLLA